MIYYILIGYFIIINISGFIIMGVDKKRAIKKKWRIREKTLFVIAVVGGSIGCIIGIKFYRHKTKHKSFTIGMPVILVIQIITLGYIMIR